MHAGKKIALACVLIAGGAAWWLLLHTPAAVDVDALGPNALNADASGSVAEGPDAMDLEPSVSAGARSERSVAELEPQDTRDQDDQALLERRWLLSFSMETEVSEEIPGLLVERPDGTRHTARLHPETGLYRLDVVGTRAELEEMELTASSGRGLTAKRAMIQLEDDGPVTALGTLSLRGAIWDFDRATIQGGPLKFEAPAILGSLILDPPGVGGVTFDVTAVGPNGPMKVRIDFQSWDDMTSATLATFVPLTEWTARVISGPAMASQPEWKATAPAGTDIVVPLSDTGGVQISVNTRHLHKTSKVVIVRLPSPRLTTMSKEALDERTRNQGLPPIHLGGGTHRLVRAGHFPLSTRPTLLPRGQYMVEAWGENDETGEWTLVVDQPVGIHDRIVDVSLD